MRTIHTDEIIKNIKEMCIEANLSLTEDMKCRFKNATESEKSPLGKQILNQLQENMEIAAADHIPICQDTGMAIVFLNIGQDVHIEGMDLHDAVNEGVRQGYTEGYLRKSVVKDPLIRENTKDNTPAIMHIDIVPGENLEILVAPKGFGSENMSRIFMLKPADGEEGIKKSVIQAVKDAGMLDDTIFILTSDHGGIDKGHGGKTMQEMETAFIISGKNIKKGLRFDDVSMMQYDVASTIACIFNLEQPQVWIGRPMEIVFK